MSDMEKEECGCQLGDSLPDTVEVKTKTPRSRKVGTREEVMNGLCQKTKGGLTIDDLEKVGDKIMSKRKREMGIAYQKNKQEMPHKNLVKHQVAKHTKLINDESDHKPKTKKMVPKKAKSKK